MTESLSIGNPEQAVAELHRMRDLGVRIALDDFGTGYSSLGYLRRFPFDVLKIDRAFVRDIADPDAAAIVRAVVGIGARLGIRIVAEGVETFEQLEIVRREGCTEVQGYLLSKPLTAAEAATFVPRMPGEASDTPGRPEDAPPRRTNAETGSAGQTALNCDPAVVFDGAPLVGPA